MASNMKCSSCDQYRIVEHNYCRMCGFHFAPGEAPFARIAVEYTTDERFCGFCGGAKGSCDCVS